MGGSPLHPPCKCISRADHPHPPCKFISKDGSSHHPPIKTPFQGRVTFSPAFIINWFLETIAILGPTNNICSYENQRRVSHRTHPSVFIARWQGRACSRSSFGSTAETKGACKRHELCQPPEKGPRTRPNFSTPPAAGMVGGYAFVCGMQLPTAL